MNKPLELQIMNYFKRVNYENKNIIYAPKNSWKLIEWIILESTLSKNDKYIAIIIASFYNTKLGYSFPSYKKIMHRSGFSKSKIQQSIRAMKNSKEWNIEQETTSSGFKSSNKYIPLYPLIENNNK